MTSRLTLLQKKANKKQPSSVKKASNLVHSLQQFVFFHLLPTEIKRLPMMVSTLVPPHKRKTKHDSKAVEMPSSIDNSKNKKRKKSPTAKVEVAPLYKEDIGKVGVKEAKPAKSSGPILKGPENQNFAISESAEEKLRRLRRKVRSKNFYSYVHLQFLFLFSLLTAWKGSIWI